MLPMTALTSAGNTYMSLVSWAQQNGFTIRWTIRDKVAELSNRNGSRLVFTVNSRTSQINGVEVSLSYPILGGNGAASIASLDVRTAVNPILYPQKNARGDKIKTIVLDPGHGGKDPGYIYKSVQEKNFNLLLAREVRDQLVKAGFNVSLTRNTDTFVDLPDRPALANKRGADLFISLHFNSVETGAQRVSGTQVYCMTPVGASSSNAEGRGAGSSASTGNRNDSKNIQLAYQIQKSLKKNLSAEDQGVRRARYAVLRDAQMPAVLVEGGYLSHPAEGKKIADSAYRKLMAKGIVSGVLAYKGLVEQ